MAVVFAGNGDLRAPECRRASRRPRRPGLAGPGSARPGPAPEHPGPLGPGPPARRRGAGAWSLPIARRTARPSRPKVGSPVGPAAGVGVERVGVILAREESSVIKSWAGPLVTGPDRRRGGADPGAEPETGATRDARPRPAPAASAPTRQPRPRRPRGIGRGSASIRSATRSSKNHMQVAAVWLPPVAMEGMPDVGRRRRDPPGGRHPRHRGNPNGFAKDEFVPYLKIAYAIVPGRGRPGDPRGAN